MKENGSLDEQIGLIWLITSWLQTRVKNISTANMKPTGDGVFQRKCTCGQHTIAGGECDDCRKKNLTLQRRSTNAAEPATGRAEEQGRRA